MKIKVVTIQNIIKEHEIDTNDSRVINIANINKIYSDNDYEQAMQAVSEITGIDWDENDGKERICGVFNENDECLMEI